MATLTIRKGAEAFEVPLDEIGRYTGAFFLGTLKFKNWGLWRLLRKESRRLRAYESKEQVWLGQYFEREILSPTLPQVSLRWIDREIGWGVFAEKDFQEMAFIAEYTGVLRKRTKQDKKNAYCFEYLIVPGPSSPYLIDAQEEGNVARYINHSKEGNLQCALATVEGVSHIVLHTKRFIQKGEQLLYDYGPYYWKRRKGKILYE
jgi:hypothetical protein